MSETTISRFAVPELADLADDVRSDSRGAGKGRLVPNVFLMLAHRPAEFRASSTITTR